MNTPLDLSPILSQDRKTQTWANFQGLGRVNARPFIGTERHAILENLVLRGGRTDKDAIQSKPLHFGSTIPHFAYETVRLKNVEVADWAMSDPQFWAKDSLGRPIKPHVDCWQHIFGYDPTMVTSLYTENCFFHDSPCDTLFQDGNAGVIHFRKHRLQKTHQGFKFTQNATGTGIMAHIIFENCHDFPVFLLGRVGGVKRIEFRRCTNYQIVANEMKVTEIIEESTDQYIEKLEKQTAEFEKLLAVRNQELITATDTIKRVSTEKEEIRAKARTGLEDAQKKMQELLDTFK